MMYAFLKTLLKIAVLDVTIAWELVSRIMVI